MSSEVMEKANELAEAIIDCDELVILKSAEMAMNNDAQAVEILDKFREKQQQIYNLQSKGQELSDQDKKEIEGIENQMEGNNSIKTYIAASQKFENLMRSVNMVITRALSGQDEAGCGCGSACGPDCGSDCGTDCN